MIDFANWLVLEVAVVAVLVVGVSSILRIHRLPSDWRAYWQAPTGSRARSLTYQTLRITAAVLGVFWLIAYLSAHRAYWQAWRELRDAGEVDLAMTLSRADLQLPFTLGIAASIYVLVAVVVLPRPHPAWWHAVAAAAFLASAWGVSVAVG